MKKRYLGLAVAAATVLAAPSLHAGTIFAGGYPDKLLVFDEALGKTTQRLILSIGLPRGMQLSNDGKRLYVTSVSSGIEVVDVATRKSLDSFSLDGPRTRYRFNGGVADSKGRYFYLLGEHFDKLNDRYKVSKYQYIAVDLKEKKIVRAVDVADEDLPQNSYRQRLLLSEDDKTLYVLGEKITVVDTADFKVTQRIDLAKPPAGEFEDGSFGGSLETLRSPREYVSLFNASEGPIGNNVFGIARFDLSTKHIDFKPIGPAPEAVAGLQVTPDGKEGYTVATIGKLGNRRCEFWRFDLGSNTVLAKSEFECRSRFNLGMSADGSKLYIYGASYEIDVYDAKTLRYEKTWALGNDATGAGIVVIR
ncbi:MAG: hypothetical protein QM661_04650 [Solimonas sp.]